jgi:hypothetical protein
VPTKRSAIALAFGASAGGADDLDALGAEDRVEGNRELGVVVAEQEAQWPLAFLETPGRFRACWATQAPLGFSVIPAMSTRRLEISMKKGT